MEPNNGYFLESKNLACRISDSYLLKGIRNNRYFFPNLNHRYLNAIE